MLSLKVKHLAKTRANYYCLSQSQLLCSSSSSTLCNSYATSSSSGCGSGSFGTTTWLPTRPSTTISDLNTDLIRLRKDIMAVHFKEWFKSRHNDDVLMKQIFKILRSSINQDQDHHHHHLVDTKLSPSDDLSLSKLGLRLTEKFVLEVLRYGHRKESVLSCIKFFDWAGESGFRHTRATYNCLFNILSKEKLMSSLLAFLERLKYRNTHKVRFHDTLVMGYAVAGRPETALQEFGKMRFQGLDLDSFGYHVVLNALVEQNRFDAVEVIAKQISLRGFENEITFCVMMKSFCNQKLFDEAEAYFRELVRDEKPLSGHELGLLVHALCKSNKFERAGNLIEEFQDLSMAVLENAYGVWILDLVKAGKLDGALEFFKTKKSLDGYLPDVFRYNTLICRLLRENRLMEVYDLLTEMKEGQISPDKITMNAALCLLCKAGMVDVALDLYNSRSEFGLSPNSMAYNYLINTLCGYGSTDEAYHVLKNSIDQGYCPGRKTFSIIADALCREGNLDRMEELVSVALERNFPGGSVFSKFISAFCRAMRLEYGHKLHRELNRRNKVTTKNAYFNLIKGFIVEMQKKGRSFNGENAATLLSEMQKKGHMPTRKLFRSVIECVCGMENPEKQFQNLLEMQLSPEPIDCYIYNFLIDGAGHAQKPDLAKHVFDLMWSKGIKPNLCSDILLLQSYLRNNRIFDALNFFNDLRKRRKIGRKLYNSLITGLCKANRADIALEFMREMKENNIVPSIECYEILIQLLCSNKRYDTAVNLIIDFEKEGRQVTSFIGNILLLHALKSQELYKTWFRLREAQDETSGSSMLGMLIGAFCGRVTVNEHVAKLEEVIEKCFPLDVYTYNMLFRRRSIDREHAIELYKRMRRKGYEPNQWTIDILQTRFPSCGWLDEVH